MYSVTYTFQNSALAIIQHEWFKVSSTKTSDPLMVEAFLSCLNDFSSELMQHVVNLADANVSRPQLTLQTAVIL